MTNNPSTTSQDLLHRLFAEEFRQVTKGPLPKCEISFYPYCGLTNTIRARNGQILIRLSDLLANAPSEILRSALAILISKLLHSQVAEEAQVLYRHFVSRPEFRQKVHKMRRQRGAKRLSSPVGCVFDLRKIFQELSEMYFGNQLTIRHLSWSQRANRTTLGHFDSAHETIVINKRLDDARVPRYVVSYVVYHEMLHALLGEELSGHGRRIHHRRFREAERRFSDYSRAKAFIRDHYHDLELI